MLRTAPLRALDDRDLPEVRALLRRDPVTDVFAASRVDACGGLDSWRLGAQMWGYRDRGKLVSLCYAGANLVPVQATYAAVRAFADRAERQGRRCSSIVGPVDAVGPMWQLLEPSWGPAREVRHRQPHMVATTAPVSYDPAVRRVRPDELDVVLPACVAMFTEEVGVSPVGGDGGVMYRSRVGELVRQGRAFARIENGSVVFKAEIAAATRQACQIQGVWVAPEHRGRGLAAAGMAAVVREALRSVAPVVSLYVNDYNAPARAAYRRAGFAEVGCFMSVLF